MSVEVIRRAVLSTFNKENPAASPTGGELARMVRRVDKELRKKNIEADFQSASKIVKKFFHSTLWPREAESDAAADQSTTSLVTQPAAVHAVLTNKLPADAARVVLANTRQPADIIAEVRPEVEAIIRALKPGRNIRDKWNNPSEVKIQNYAKDKLDHIRKRCLTSQHPQLMSYAADVRSDAMTDVLVGLLMDVLTEIAEI